MSVSDVIKKSVVDMFSGQSTIGSVEICMRLIISALLGLYVFFVYKHEAKTAFYSKDLNITMAGLSVVISALMVAMQSSILVSLGMVGALSIVRFRTAVKNPLDLMYVFWAITNGIICGVGLHWLAVLVCAVMTGLDIVLQLVPNARASSVVVLRTSQAVDWDEVIVILNKYGKHIKEKARSSQRGGVEVIFELTTSQQDELMEALDQFEGLEEIHVLSHDGEYRV